MKCYTECGAQVKEDGLKFNLRMFSIQLFWKTMKFNEII